MLRFDGLWTSPVDNGTQGQSPLVTTFALDDLLGDTCRKNVRWTGDECYQLAEKMIELRINHPKKSNISLINLAQATLIKLGEWQPHRERTISSNDQIAQVFPFLIQLDRDRQTIFKQATTVKQKLEEAEKSKVDLDEMPIEEVMTFFGDKVLENTEPAELVHYFSPEELIGSLPLPKLAGYVAEQLVTAFLARPSAELPKTQTQLNGNTNGDNGHNGHTNGHAKTPPVIAVIGAQPHQAHRLVKHFEGRAQIVNVDKMKIGGTGEAIKSNFDGVVVWAQHTSKMQRQIIKRRCESG
ncbi:hypothetical protein [Aeoliella sp. SH292]|uniref:hypothetical protein n=1 Tax=Aeoliella sp. SH292 TaxID=3454464 RepID=UPI003F9C9E59